MDGDVSRGAQRAPSLQMPSESKLENQISKIENLKIKKNPPRKISESQSATSQIRRLRSCRLESGEPPLVYSSSQSQCDQQLNAHIVCTCPSPLLSSSAAHRNVWQPFTPPYPKGGA
jgi:hypothetical protein